MTCQHKRTWLDTPHYNERHKEFCLDCGAFVGYRPSVEEQLDLVEQVIGMGTSFTPPNLASIRRSMAWGSRRNAETSMRKAGK